MFLLKLLNLNKKCSHEKIAPNVDSAYCPDCGKLIQNEWYISRCSCCGVKLKTISKNGAIMPELHYCANCGNSTFNVEKIEKINFIDINFAVLVKKIVEESSFCSTTQCWQEKTIEQPKLLVQYL